MIVYYYKQSSQFYNLNLFKASRFKHKLLSIHYSSGLSSFNLFNFCLSLGQLLLRYFVSLFLSLHQLLLGYFSLLPTLLRHLLYILSSLGCIVLPNDSENFLRVIGSNRWSCFSPFQNNFDEFSFVFSICVKGKPVI